MYESISMQEFEQKIKREKICVLDVREDSEHMIGFIEEAKLIPMTSIVERLGELDSATKYYVICHSGGRSAKVCKYLTSNRFRVVNVIGGMSCWRGKLGTE